MSVGLKVRTRTDAKKVVRKVKRANIENIGHAGAAVRLTAKRSVRKRKKASTPGKPPHTRGGQLRKAILYSVEKSKQRTIIGPSFQVVGRSATAHEFGGRYKRERYRRRPFMGPALEQVKPRLPKMWASSVR